MPLRDHLHSPVSKRASWEGFQGLWPGIIVQQLAARLPNNYVAEPRVHLPSSDVSQTNSRRADKTGYFVLPAGSRSKTSFSPSLVVRNAEYDHRSGRHL